jgi:hypothetical protein
MKWLINFWETLTLGKILLGVLILVVSFAFSTIVVSIIMVKIPANYFHSDYEHHFLTDRHPLLRWTVIIIKNIVGVLLILIGLIMAFPGVPGPGVLTILIGLILIDLPGKRKFEALIIKRPTILSAVSSLRTRYKKEPLLLD